MKKLISILAILIIGTATIKAQQGWEKTLPTKKLSEANSLLSSNGYKKQFEDEELSVHTNETKLNWKITMMYSVKSKIVNGITISTKFISYTGAENRYNELKGALLQKYELVNEEYEFDSPYNASDNSSDKYLALKLGKADIHTLFSSGNDNYVNISIAYSEISNSPEVLVTYMNRPARDIYEKEKEEKIKSQY